MAKQQRVVDIDAAWATPGLVKNAIRRGACEAMKRHIQAGVPMVGGRDGRSVLIYPEELKEILAKAEAELAAAAEEEELALKS